ncbi:hypothetical protein Scep_004002 [Stephania cephalantha]|uniref:Uncharacterized protein n=1 Tax=Stephania cephalantha TaxID=152367 RepID=A0AAP0KT46_9MAGN
MVHAAPVTAVVSVLPEIAAPAVATLNERDTGFDLTLEARQTGKYKRYRPRKFNGDSDVSKAKKFIRIHEKIQRLLRLEDSKRPRLVAFSFSGDIGT